MTYTVLVVDDSLTVRMDLEDALRESGFRPLSCATLAEARRILSQTAIDALVLDVRLPDGDGIAMLDEIRSTADGPALPIIMLSSEAEIKDRIRGLRMGADEYVGKPYEVGYLVGRLEELVQTRQPIGATTILIIDDSPTYRSALHEALTAAGYVVLQAQSGEDGLRLAATRRPQAVVVDGELPGIDGATVIRRIRLDAALRDIPCLLLTASEREHSELRALDAGADGFARKQEGLDIILVRVAALLRRAPARVYGAAETRSVLGPKKILTVDDNVTYLHELERALKEEGYEVILAHSGEEALDLLAVQKVDCVVLDLLMRGLSGSETCERIKAAPVVREIPLIIVSALEDRDAIIRALSAGADDYVAKSSEMSVLRARVRAQIRRKHFEDEHRRIREELLRKELEAAEARAARELAETKAVLVEELERKNRELEAFSYSVSHDLRAPLRAIDGFSRIVLEDCGDSLEPQTQTHLQHIRGAAVRMGELIDDLLELSRVSRADLRRAPVDLSTIAREIVAQLREQSDRQVDCVIESDLQAEADRGLIRIVLENLFSNGWKFTARVPDPCIEFGRRQDAGPATFFVRDNGAGFDMAYANKLFLPFQRLHSESEFSGTGVGLATIHRIIERHGGHIWAEAERGHGATFFFTIPSEREARVLPTAADITSAAHRAGAEGAVGGR